MRNPPKVLTVFDSEALSRVIAQDPYLRSVALDAYLVKAPVIVSAATLIEVTYPKMNRAGFDWAISRLRIIPVTEHLAKEASKLLADAGMHGHKHALDAMVAATAIQVGGVPYLFTSDPDDIRALVGKAASVIPLT